MTAHAEISRVMFKRVPREGILIPREHTGRWHCWLMEQGYWLGDFCHRKGSYGATMIAEGEKVRILPDTQEGTDDDF